MMAHWILAFAAMVAVPIIIGGIAAMIITARRIDQELYWGG